ncbi:hypothetical protein QC761_0055150 [Podospora bellae-mahoneyi]|uniref:Uncharacterized protein n=1 Tax=Podospora bellae-mahoneyi TaxID=2093777 RepID=A0ABR0FMZ7_9PEZI|nr:hypothetical protein QC761_0055150 [Podospora bellae-mahoneyi]
MLASPHPAFSKDVIPRVPSVLSGEISLCACDGRTGKGPPRIFVRGRGICRLAKPWMSAPCSNPVSRCQLRISTLAIASTPKSIGEQPPFDATGPLLSLDQPRLTSATSPDNPVSSHTPVALGSRPTWTRHMLPSADPVDEKETISPSACGFLGRFYSKPFLHPPTTSDANLPLAATCVF